MLWYTHEKDQLAYCPKRPAYSFVTPLVKKLQKNFGFCNFHEIFFSQLAVVIVLCKKARVLKHTRVGARRETALSLKSPGKAVTLFFFARTPTALNENTKASLSSLLLRGDAHHSFFWETPQAISLFIAVLLTRKRANRRRLAPIWMLARDWRRRRKLKPRISPAISLVSRLDSECLERQKSYIDEQKKRERS